MHIFGFCVHTHLTLQFSFYANNIPFNAANSKQYQEMLTALRPGYTGPSSDQIGGKLLDQLNDKIDKELAEHVRDNSTLTLIMDGWSVECSQ